MRRSVMSKVSVKVVDLTELEDNDWSLTPGPVCWSFAKGGRRRFRL